MGSTTLILKGSAQDLLLGFSILFTYVLLVDLIIKNKDF